MITYIMHNRILRTTLFAWHLINLPFKALAYSKTMGCLNSISRVFAKFTDMQSLLNLNSTIIFVKSWNALTTCIKAFKYGQTRVLFWHKIRKQVNLIWQLLGNHLKFIDLTDTFNPYCFLWDEISHHHHHAKVCQIDQSNYISSPN